MYDFSSFDNFVTSTNGQQIGQGECWDYVNLVWNHLDSRYYTYPPSDPSSTNHGVKWGWINAEARQANTISGISQIANLSDVKRGDIVVISDGTYGHAGFADEDYDGSGNLYMYDQNYNNIRYVMKHHVSMATFVGAFRYDAWYTPPTPPTPTEESARFPWFIYARKIRTLKSGL